MSEIKYTREALLKCEQFAYVQKDFLAALLVKDEYTISEVKKLISAFERRKA